MKVLKNEVLLIVLCLVSLAASAQRVISLEECRQLALDNNKKLKMAKEEVNKANYEYYSSYANFLPKITATGTYMHNSRNIQLISDENIAALNGMGTTTQAQIDAYREEILAIAQADPLAVISWALLQHDPLVNKLVTDLLNLNVEDALNEIGQEVTDALQIDTKNIYAGIVSFQQPIFAGGKIAAYYMITKDLKELAALKLEMQEQETVVSTEKAYWQIVSIANKKRLAENYTELLRSISKDVEKMVAEGVATNSDLLSVKVKLNEAETGLLKAQNGLSLSKMLLCKQCGLPLDSDIVLADEQLEDVVVTNTQPYYTESDVEANRPELKCLCIANDIYAKKVKVTRADYLPTIGAFGNYVISNPSCFNGFENKFKGMWNVGIIAKIPIFHWGEGYYKVRMAKAEANIQQYNYEDSKEMIMLQVRQCETKLSEANSRMLLTQEKLNDADENLRMATSGFREGFVTSSVMEQAQTAWLQAHSEYIDAKIDRIMAEVYLRQAAGVSLK